MKKKRCRILAVFCSDSVTRVNDSNRVTIFGDSDSTRVTLKKMVTRLESRFSQNESTRVNYPLYTAQLLDSRWIGNPINHSSTTVNISQSCLSAHFFNHTRFSESN